MTRFKEFILSDFSNKNKKLFLALVATLLLVLSAVISMVAGVHSRKNSDDKESSTASHVILKTSCDNTRYPDLCYSSIANAPGAMKKVTSQKDVIELSLNLTTTAVEHNFFKIEKLLKTIDLNKREKTALHDYLETIDETLDELHMQGCGEDLHEYPNTTCR